MTIMESGPWGMSVVLLLGAVACGDGASAGAGGAGGGPASSTTAGAGGGGGGAEGGSGGGDVAPEPARRGQVSLTRGRIGALDDANIGAYLLAEFFAEPEAPPPATACELATVEGCNVQDCLRQPEEPAGEEPGGEDPGDPSPFVSAGVISVEGLATPVSVAPGEEGHYWMDLDPGAFSGGAAARIVAAGDVVPGFAVDVVAPAFLTFTSPQLDDDLVVERDQGLALAWDHGAGAGQVRAFIEAAVPEGEQIRVVSVACDAEVTDGALTLPAAALRELPTVTDAFFFVSSREEAEVVAGDWRVVASFADVTALYETVEIR